MTWNQGSIEKMLIENFLESSLNVARALARLLIISIF